MTEVKFLLSGIKRVYYKYSQVALGVKNPSANAGDSGNMGLILGLGRSPGEGNGNSLQYYCLGNLMDRGVYWVTVYGIAYSQT